MKITLLGERPKSWNDYWAGKHWSYRAVEARRVHELLFHAPYTGDLLGLEPVAITITTYFKNRPIDCDGVCVKPYIDGLKGWLIKDDTPEYVRSVTTRSCVDKKNPRLEIEIEEIK